MLSLNKLPNQKPEEKTILFFRRHWLILFKKILLVAAIAVIPIIFYFLFKKNILIFWKNEIGRPLLILAVSAYYLFVWLFLFVNFIDYYLDIWLVTNERIIDIEQEILFGRTVAELNLYRVQDVTSEIKGILPTIFHYGTIYVQTAGEKERFIFENIPNPYRVAKNILELAEKNKEQQRNGFAMQNK